jgi:hypothetical protein
MQLPSQQSVAPKTKVKDDALHVECDDPHTLSAFMIFCTREIGSRDFPDSLTRSAVAFVAVFPFGRPEGLFSDGGGVLLPA